MEIGKRIYELRKSQNLTLQELGDRVGVGASTIRKWEIGYIANVRSDKIQRLADALGVTPAYIMGWENNGPHRTITHRDEEKELLRIYQALSVKDKVRLLSVAIELEEAAQV